MLVATHGAVNPMSDMRRRTFITFLGGAAAGVAARGARAAVDAK
jgi:hypothetical protein